MKRVWIGPLVGVLGSLIVVGAAVWFIRAAPDPITRPREQPRAISSHTPAASFELAPLRPLPELTGDLYLEGTVADIDGYGLPGASVKLAREDLLAFTPVTSRLCDCGCEDVLIDCTCERAK